jgi:dienelactone hydrolase
MKYYILIIITFFISMAYADAQNLKKDLDTAAFNTWGSVTGPQITDDGKYAGYFTKHGLAHDFSSPKMLTVKSVDGKWTKDFGPNIIKYAFSTDNKSVLILDDKNLLQVVQLGSGNLFKSYKANSFQLFEYNRAEYLLIKSPDNCVILVNQKNNLESIFYGVQSYYQSSNQNRLFLLSQNNALSFVDLPSMKEMPIGEFKGISNLTLDKKGEMIAFMMDGVIWFCNAGKNKPKKLADSLSPGIDKDLYISDINKFSNDNERLFITLTQKRIKQEENTEAAKVRVWNFKDSRLRTDPRKIGSSQSFLSFINLNNHNIIQVQQEYENAGFFYDIDNTDLIIIAYSRGADYERHWNKLSQPKYYIYDCKKNLRYPIALYPRSLSPDGKYVIGTDSMETNYSVYNVESHQSYDLTRRIGTIPDQDPVLGDDKKGWRIAGWIVPHTLLLYDDNDIWKIDISNPNSFTSLTKGIGAQEQLSFRFAKISNYQVLNMGQLSLLSAFNYRTKKNGFYRLFADVDKVPEKLIMSDAQYYFSDYIPFIGQSISKAKNTNIWLVNRQRVDASPNLFVTTDFKFFKPISNIYPEKEYKWLTSELVNFTTLDGKPSQAILYKPQDLDANKKYPVVFYYYQKYSDELHSYIQPEAAAGDLNIPWFVSKGYIVVKPDIQYTLMKPGESAVNSVEGVARFVAKLPYIDSANLGVMGHSWGAYETNYIVTHSNFFKAAVSASGNSNLISATTSISLRGINFKDISTYTRYERFGKSLWERPDLYIDNSPILKVNNVETPILLMANANDAQINVDQGIAFFWALRRLRKPSWLLQYEGEAHTLNKQENRFDYSQKVLDFFDYYLKGRPIPQWMNEAL